MSRIDVRVRFGTLVLALEGMRDLDQLLPLYEAHAAPPDEENHAVITAVLDEAAGDDAVARPGPIRWGHAVVGDELHVRGPQWTLEVSLSPRGPVRARFREWDVRQVDQLLGCAVQVMAPLRVGALTLHGSSVERDGQGFAFIAPSETGKTTVALLSRELGHTVLAEELTYVGWPQDGGGPAVYSLPARERNDIRTTRRVSAPLAGLYRLVQAREDVVEPIDRRRRVLELTARAAVGVRAPVVMDAALRVVERLNDAVELRRLRFSRSPRFWDAIDADRRRRGRFRSRGT